VTGNPGLGVALVVGLGDELGAPQLEGLVMRLVSNVTAPFRASARPGRIFARVVRVMLVRARMFP
jgi:hypothetical protein